MVDKTDPPKRILEKVRKGKAELLRILEGAKITLVMLLRVICFPLITDGFVFAPQLTFAAHRAILADTLEMGASESTAMNDETEMSGDMDRRK